MNLQCKNINLYLQKFSMEWVMSKLLLLDENLVIYLFLYLIFRLITHFIERLNLSNILNKITSFYILI